MCGSIWQTSNLRRLRIGEEKRKKKEEEETTGRKYNGLPALFHRAAIIVADIGARCRRQE